METWEFPFIEHAFHKREQMSPLLQQIINPQRLYNAADLFI